MRVMMWRMFADRLITFICQLLICVGFGTISLTYIRPWEEGRLIVITLLTSTWCPGFHYGQNADALQGNWFLALPPLEELTLCETPTIMGWVQQRVVQVLTENSPSPMDTLRTTRSARG
uniref:(northern house mosquito) hypothetical protein n=1 Tax=Culex pipiens TaxID=7175 RepID=A0A8D8ADB3_CULPI